MEVLKALWKLLWKLCVFTIWVGSTLMASVMKGISEYLKSLLDK